MKTAIIAASAMLTLGACATAPSGPVYSAEATQFTGYVLFNDGEFQLYPREAQVRTPFSRPCLSGALPLNAMRAARQDLSGQKVTFTGRAVAWEGRVIDRDGVNVTNTCGGDFVLLADDVEVIR
jgi:hypothetical protein